MEVRMSSFVSVVGKFPAKQEKDGGYFFLSKSCIKAVYPLWGVKNEQTGKYNAC
jgi:hypothetical protein